MPCHAPCSSLSSRTCLGRVLYQPKVLVYPRRRFHRDILQCTDLAAHYILNLAQKESPAVKMFTSTTSISLMVPKVSDRFFFSENRCRIYGELNRVVLLVCIHSVRIMGDYVECC